MTRRIFRSMMSVVTVIILLVVGLIFGTMYDNYAEERKNDLHSYALLVRTGVEEIGMSYLEALPETDHRVTWVDADGIVLFDNQADPETMDNHSTRAEILEAEAGGEGYSQRFSDTLSDQTMYYALHLNNDTYIRVSTSMETVFAVFTTIASPMVGVLIFALILSLIVAYYISKIIIKPINEIDLEHPENLSVYEELTPLLYRISAQNKQLQKQMDDLQRQKQEFDMITANMQEGLLVLDSKGGVFSYNEGVLHLMNIDPPKKRESVFVLNRSEGFRQCVEKALDGKHWEERVMIGDRMCQLFANPVIQYGVVAGVILLLFDITEKEEREILRREFTANVSHELKTPLTSISGFAEIMKNGMVRPDDVPHFSGKIYDEAQRLIQLVQDIIKLSRLDEKQTIMEKEMVDIAALAMDVGRRLEPIAAKKSVEIAVETEPVSMMCVSQVMQEMVYNLCDNAIRYNKDGGKVCLDVKKSGNAMILSVKDTGIGIAPENQKRVFERFYRESASRSKETDGTGLGLSIVKHGAIIHNAKIDLKSKLGEGTEITIRFPIKNQ
ncbi:ATP-binding protein [Chakrabartyella piscis]|uniref:sensor histidine kinase n=1 Tax=Chakrabartyella piscis TaxID=2918914 RepID=UPI002958C474|nr:ATP-binding protein [Chakrabartyella piscis]